MFAFAEFAISRFAELGDLSGAFGVHRDWGRWDRRVEGEERAVEVVQCGEFFLEGARVGG